MSGWLLLMAMIAPVAIVIAVMRNERHRSALRSETVELRVDVLGVRRSLADGREEAVDWDEIREVEVVLVRSGPHSAYGGVVMLAGDDLRGVLVPLDRLDTSGLAEQLARLPGFDTRRLLEAVQGRSPSNTTVWSRHA